VPAGSGGEGDKINTLTKDEKDTYRNIIF